MIKTAKPIVRSSTWSGSSKRALAISFGIIMLGVATGQAQEKISSNIEVRTVNGDTQGRKAARVIVVMRGPKIGLAPSSAFSSPANYLRAKLSQFASNTSSIAGLPVVVSEVTEDGLRQLENDPNVAFILPDRMTALPILSTQTVSTQDLPPPKNIAAGGSGNTVAILDTGIDTTHNVFADKTVNHACFSTSNSNLYRLQSLCPNGLDHQFNSTAGKNCNDSIDGCNHGTHVASIAVGNSEHFKGIAPQANLMSIQVFTRFDDPNVCGTQIPCILSFDSDQLRALKHVEDLADKYKIASVNMSLGGGRYLTACDSTSRLSSIIDILSSRGVFSAIASGNDGFGNAVSNPGCVSNAITVTATKENGDIDIDYANVSGDVDIAAQGTKVLGALPNGQYGRLTGTSMATPAVAGLLAVLSEIRPAISLAEVNQIISRSGDLVTDPRSGISIPKMNIAESKEFAKKLNKDSPVVASFAADGTDGRFVNAQSVAVTKDVPFTQSEKVILQKIIGRGIVEISDSKTLVINHPSGFTPNAIKALKSAIGSNVKLFEHTLSRTNVSK